MRLRPPKPPLSFHRIQTHCHTCNYSLRGPRYTKCPECGADAWRELSEDDSRLLTHDEATFLRELRPGQLVQDSWLTCFVVTLLLLLGAMIALASLLGLSSLTRAIAMSTVLGILAIAFGRRLLRLDTKLRRDLRRARQAIAFDRADALAATTYLDIQQSILVRGGWYGSQIKMLFLRHRDTLVAEFNLDTIKDLFPGIATRTPARIAIDFLPNTGIVLTARPASQETIPTEHREIEIFDDHWGVLTYEIEDLDEFIVLKEGDPSLFPSHSDVEQP